MITDTQLYSLAVVLGGLSMLLIVLYHFLEVNAIDTDIPEEKELTGKGGVAVHGGRRSAIEKAAR